MNFPLLNGISPIRYRHQRLKHQKQQRSASTSFFKQTFNNYRHNILNNSNHNIRIYNNNNNNISNDIFGIYNQTHLNNLLCKLKNYYNELLYMNNQKQKHVESLQNESLQLQFQQNQLHEFNHIELENERISVKNFNELVVSKSQIENNLHKLIQEKEELEYKYNNELEYSKTIEYMYENEKMNLERLYNSTKVIENKIAMIKKYKKDLDDNIRQRNKKRKNFKCVIDKLQNEIHMIQNVVNNQTKLGVDIDNNISLKESNIEMMKENIKNNSNEKIKEIKQYKNNIRNKIAIVNEKERNRTENEKNYIKTILCLDLMQNYFLNQNEFSLHSLYQSKDYALFLTEKLEIVDDDNNIVFNSWFNEKRKGISKEKENALININNSNNVNSSNSNVSSIKKLTLNELYTKFNNLQLTKAQLYEYHSKLINRLSFYRSTINNYNNKLIQYENKKEKFYIKVKEIIEKDYKNFIDLVKNNNRFKMFLNKNHLLLNNAKELFEMNKEKKINKKYTSCEPKENDNKELIIETPIEVMARELYKKCHMLIREHINFFENIFKETHIIIKVNHKHQDLLNKLTTLSNNIGTYLSDINQLNEIDFHEYLQQLIQKSNNIDINNEFINNFYTNTNNKRELNEKFVNQFLKKNFALEKQTFQFFNIKNDMLDILRTIFDLNKESTQGKFMRKNESECTRRSSVGYNSERETPTINSYASNVNLFSYSKLMQVPIQQAALSHRSNRRKDSQMSEDSSSLSETETTQHEVKLFKQRNNSLDERIIKKLYEPHLAKTFYIRSLNDNMKCIKSMTNSSTKTNFVLNKKKEEVDELSKQLILYQNPKININQISNDTYNSVLNFVIKKKLRENNSRYNTNGKNLSKSFYGKSKTNV